MFKKIILAVFLTLTAFVSFGQSDWKGTDYHFWYSMSIGKGDATVTNNNAILELGKPGTNKGLILPRSATTSILPQTDGMIIFDMPSKSIFYTANSQWIKIGAPALYSEYYDPGNLPLQSVTGQPSVSIMGADVSGTNSIGMSFATVDGQNAFAFGQNNNVNGTANYSFLGGSDNTSYSIYGTIFGKGNSARASYETLIGSYSTDYTPNGTNDRAFNIGVGTGTGARADAFSVFKNKDIRLQGYVSSRSDGAATKVLYTDANGFLKLGSYTETDPIFTASPAATITTTNIANWNTAYNKKINSIGFASGTLTLTQQDGSTLTANTFNTTNIPEGTNLYYTDARVQTFADTRYSLLTHTHNATFTGDATGTGTITGSIALTIPNSTVTYAKMQNIAASRLLGRYAATSGIAQEISLGTGLTLNSTTGVLSNSGVITETDPIWTAAIPNYYTKTNLQTSGQAAVHYGNLTNIPNTVLSGDVSGTGTTAITTTIQPATVTYAKIQNVTASRLLGRYTASTGVTQEISLGTGLSLNSTTGVLSNSGIITETDPTAIKNQTAVQTGANFNIDGDGIIGGTTTTNQVQSINNNDLLLWGQNGSINFATAATTVPKMVLNDDGRLGIGVLPTSARASLLEVNGNAWATDAWILGTGSAPIAEFGLSGANNAFVRTMGTGNVLLQTNASTVVATANGTTNNFEVTNQIKISGGVPGLGKVLTSDGAGLASWQAPSSNGTVTSVGLTSSDITVGGTSPITTSGTFTLTLPNINSNVGTFNNVTVNAKGQVTAASNVGYLTSYTETDPIANAKTVNVSGTAPISVSGGSQAISANPTFTITHANSGVTAGTYNNVTVNATGHVTTGSNVAYLTSYTETDPIVSARTLTFSNGTGISVAGGTQNLGANRTWTITNTAPDQTVTMANGTGISVTGTYPNFTITNTAPMTGSFINNSTSLQSSANFNISGTGQAAKLGVGGAPSGTPIFYVNGASRFDGYLDIGGVANISGIGSATFLSLGVSGQSILGAVSTTASTGKVGIGQTSGTEMLEVTGNIYATGTVTAAGGGFNSLRTLKKDISDFTGDALKLIDSLKIYNFKYKSNDKDKFIGMIIDEKKEVPNEFLMKDGTAINTYNTISLLIKSIQQLNERLEKLEKTNEK